MDDQSGWDIFGGVLNNVLDGFWGSRTEPDQTGFWPTAQPDTLGQYLPLLLIAGLGLLAFKVLK